VFSDNISALKGFPIVGFHGQNDLVTVSLRAFSLDQSNGGLFYMTLFRQARVLALALAGGWFASSALTVSMAHAAQPALQAEQSDVATLPAMKPHWFLPHTGEDAFTLYDGDSAKILGTIPADFTSNLAVSHDGKTFYVATTMYERRDHGPREDFLQAYDAQTLKLAKEITLPPRALSVFKAQNMGLSPDGKWAYIFDMSPATGVTLVDLKGSKVARTVDTPGCALIFPWKSGGFSSLCGNGSLTNVAVDDGGVAKVSHTDKFFDAENDPVFEQSPIDRNEGVAFFVTYSGKVVRTELGATPKMDKVWTLSEAAGQPPAGMGVQDIAWRAGGRMPFAYQHASKRLYALMHMGTYWTHKADGNQVWVFDTTTQKLIQRIDLPEQALGIAVSQDAHPQLYVMAEKGKGYVYDMATAKVVHVIDANIGSVAVTPDL